MKQALDEANHTIDAYGLLMRIDEQLREANWKLEQARLEQNWPVMRQGEGIIHALTMVRRWITTSLPHLKLDLLPESGYRLKTLNTSARSANENLHRRRFQEVGRTGRREIETDADQGTSQGDGSRPRKEAS